jgi:hypothetical protein
MVVDIQSMWEKRLVSMRAVVGGTTRAAREDREAEEEHEEGVDAGDVDAGDFGDLGVEGREEEFAVVGGDDDCGGDGDEDDDPHVGGGYAEHTSENGGFDALLDPAVEAQERDSEREAGGGDDPDRGVGSDDAATADAADGETGCETPESGAHEVVETNSGAHGGAAEDGVAEPVADVAHPAEGDVHAEQAAEAAGDGAHDERVAEEVVLEWFEQDVHGQAPLRWLLNPCWVSMTSGMPRCWRTSMGAP